MAEIKAQNIDIVNKLNQDQVNNNQLNNQPGKNNNLYQNNPIINKNRGK
jgi:hypothetical protein